MKAILALTGLTLGLILAAPAWAAPLDFGSIVMAPPGDGFSLGRSKASGAVCSAVRDDADPLAMRTRDRSWRIECPGWSQPLGRIYRFVGDDAIRQASLDSWRRALATRAACPDLPDAATRTDGVVVQSCRSRGAEVKYTVYVARRANMLLAAEAFEPVADLAETGLKVAAGGAAPQSSAGAGSAQASAGPSRDLAALASLGEGGQSQETLRESAFRDSQLWRFDACEEGFGRLISGDGRSGSSSDSVAQAEAYLNAAVCTSNAGRWQEAADYFKAADGQIAQARSASLQALALDYRAVDARNRSRFEEAASLARKAIAARRQAAGGLGVDPSGALVIGPGAADSLSSNTAFRPLSLGDRDAIRDAYAYEILGTSEAELGHTDAASRALNAAARLLDDNGRNAAAPELAAEIASHRARLDREQGRAAVAARLLGVGEGDDNPVNRFVRRHPFDLPTAGLLMETAAALAAAGDDDRALAVYEQAFVIFERKRGSLGASAGLSEPYFDILLKRIAGAPRAHPAEVERFFRWSQVLISTSTAQFAAESAARLAAADPVLAAEQRELEDTGRALAAKQQELRLLREAQTYAGAQKVRIDGEIAVLSTRREVLEQRLLTLNPKYGQILTGSVALAELQQRLKPGEVYLKTFLLKRRGYAILVTADGAKPFALDWDLDTAVADIARLRRPFDDLGRGRLRPFNVELAHRLYGILLAPATTELKGAQRLIYEPDAVLIAAPLGVLVSDDASVALYRKADAAGEATPYGDMAWVARDLDISLSVSAATFVQARTTEAAARRSKGDRAIIAFADPVIPSGPRAFSSVASTGLGGSGAYCAELRVDLTRLPPLPETRSEVSAIGSALNAGPDDIVLGAAYTDAEVVRRGQDAELSHYRIVYFATHGLLPSANGCLHPSLVTSLGGSDSDGLLDTGKIFRLKLDADVVVLSACNTGNSGLDSGGGGEALGGLAQAFIYAGARNLVVSNWEVSTEATETLLTSMFKAAGETQDAALTQAERSMMARRDGHAHPYFWGAFSLVGDGAAPMPGLPTARQVKTAAGS